jgi:DNA-binding winged helix-turn-helix (wHTH) protein
MRARFGEFVLDDGEKQLLRAGAPVHLTPKAYALLCYMASQGHRALAKSEILEHLWPSTFVSESALTSVVKELRHALGDDAHEPRFIRGVRGFGYAFCGECVVSHEAPSDAARAPAPPAPAAEFRLFWQNREISLRPGENLLGRTREAAVWIEDASVSRRHAIIRVFGSQATLEDCGSKNGTFLRGVRVAEPALLGPGDEFWLGSACVVFAAYASEVSTASGSLHAASMEPASFAEPAATPAPSAAAEPASVH